MTTLKALWAELEADGWVVDGRDYLTNFRVDTKANGKSPGEWEALKARYVRLNVSFCGGDVMYIDYGRRESCFAFCIRLSHACPITNSPPTVQTGSHP